MSKYEELVIDHMSISISKLEEFIARAKKAGHNDIDVSFERGWYDEIESITLRSEHNQYADPL